VTARIACLFVPLFPLAARLRSEPELAGEALAILSGNGSASRVAAASRPARRAGVRTGQTAAQARTRLPDLRMRGRDAECERAAQQALVEAAEAFSPRVEDAGEGTVYLDVAGLESHFAGERPERAMGQSLAAAAEAVGLPARVGIAASVLAARVAAELPRSPTVVAAGQETAFLAPLPLRRLSPPEDLAETLARWGLATAGDFARLPEGEVESRLGARGRELHRRARGIDSRPLVPAAPAPRFDEGMEMEWPLVAVEPFLFVARAALDRLAGRLAAHALACRRLELVLDLEPDGVDARAIELPAPTRDVKTLLTLVRLDLEKRPPGAPVAGFRFAAHPDRPRQAQLSLFGPAALSPDRLSAMLARMAALLGLNRAGSPAPADSRLPERFALRPYDPPPPPEMPRPAGSGRGLLAVRTLRPPVALEVVGEGAPREVRPAEPAPEAGRRIEIRGAVRVASGPWKIEESWWAGGGHRRDYWDVELSDGGLYRLFCDRESGAWFADGIYD
jgi:protein ImuB